MSAQGTRISAGELRHRIDIVRPSPSQDASGGWDVSLNKLFARVWAKIETLDGTDSLVAGAEASQVVHAITIRYRTGISADMQVIFQGRLFQIKAAPNPDERNKMLRLVCVEINDSRQQSPQEV